MRYSKVATLYAETVSQDSEGSQMRTRGTGYTVFVNPMNIGAKTWVEARSAGLHADGEVQVRSLDYSGQNILTMDGEEYDVERSRNLGEFTRLTLARRVANA